MSKNIAMWSGPRNISTAMMRAWENRPDCTVWDEPLYAAYLRDTGLDHPMRDAILAHDENDWQKVIQRCVLPATDGSDVFYQKHMTHHMLPHYSTDWLADLQHCFLLRHPRDVLVSYSQKREPSTLEDIGITQQLDLFEQIEKLQGKAPMIIDSQDFMTAPENYLHAMCAHFSIPFYASMLAWTAGKRDSDGVWGEHWYGNVWQSTGFAPQLKKEARLDNNALALLERAIPAYEALRSHCLVL